jgi:hypothetical protein
MDRIFYHQTHGDDATTITLLQNTTAEVIVLGSSRASHHFISDSIEKTLKWTCFNGGRDNMGIHYVQALLPAMLQRHTPKVIILDIIPNNFLKGGQDQEKYFDIQTSSLLPFARRYPVLLNSIAEMAPLQATKAQVSKCYPYNSLVGSIFQNTFTNLGHQSIKGYEPLSDSLSPQHHSKPTIKLVDSQSTLDESALAALTKVLQTCAQHNIACYLVASPFYFSTVTKQSLSRRLNAICTSTGSTYLDFTQDQRFVGNPYSFYDELHLNNTGARLFTASVCQRVMQDHRATP